MEGPQEWEPEFVKTLDNHGAKVDMWFMRDDETGETIISVGVPHGDQDTPYKIARAVNSHATLLRQLDEARKALERMTSAFRPFTMKPMGGDGSAARAEQIEQIDAHKQARDFLSTLSPARSE